MSGVLPETYQTVIDQCLVAVHSTPAARAAVRCNRLVLRRGVALVSIGAAAGVAGSALTGPLFAHLLYGVSPRDPLALVAGPFLLGIVTLLAIWLPARRAMATDPIAALRSE